MVQQQLMCNCVRREGKSSICQLITFLTSFGIACEGAVGAVRLRIILVMNREAFVITVMSIEVDS
jgi:hypothetical protein